MYESSLNLDVDSLGEIWFTVSYLNKVFHYGMDGTLKKQIVGKSPLYKAPDRLEPPKEIKELINWNETWTRVAGCAATQSGYVILMMTAGEQGKPLMPSYDPIESPHPPGGLFLDIYDREGKVVALGLHTPHRFLCVDPQDNIWFNLRPQTPENPAKDSPVVLGKFKLKLPPAAAKTAASAGTK
jgi:hypothetical protein